MKKSYKFETETIFFPPLGKNVNILLQKHDGPCMLIAIFNSLVLKGKISIDKGIYSPTSIINIIRDYNPDVYDLEKVVHGFYVNPLFDSCTDFADYPDFLTKLGIRMVHSMVPPKRQKKYSIVKNYSYDSLQLELVELDSTKNCRKDQKILQSWNSKLKKQITSFGVKQVKKEIQEGEALIYFRRSHFSCIYKYSNHVYSLITFRGSTGQSCIWKSLPSTYRNYKYFDSNFDVTSYRD